MRRPTALACRRFKASLSSDSSGTPVRDTNLGSPARAAYSRDNQTRSGQATRRGFGIRAAAEREPVPYHRAEGQKAVRVQGCPKGEGQVGGQHHPLRSQNLPRDVRRRGHRCHRLPSRRRRVQKARLVGDRRATRGGHLHRPTASQQPISARVPQL